MTPSIAFAISVLLPALAHQSGLDLVRARVQQIHDIPSLVEELSREADRAVITVGMLPAVYGYATDIERFLETHKDFAREFGPFAWQAAHLAELYVSREIIGGSCKWPENSTLTSRFAHCLLRGRPPIFRILRPFATKPRGGGMHRIPDFLCRLSSFHRNFGPVIKSQFNP